MNILQLTAKRLRDPLSRMSDKLYSEADFQRIAGAVGIDAACVKHHANFLEAAALWFRSAAKPFERRSPTELRKRLEQISKDARQLLMHLGINDSHQAIDGPGDREIFDAIGLWTKTPDDLVTEATGRIGRLVEILDAIDAAQVLERLAERAAEETANLGRLLVAPGNSGDRATNEWIADMMVLYKKITGKEPATSVGGPGLWNEGIAGGPLIRFIRAAGAPVDLQLHEDALRKRVRTILDHHRNKT